MKSNVSIDMKYEYVVEYVLIYIILYLNFISIRTILFNIYAFSIFLSKWCMHSTIYIFFQLLALGYSKTITESAFEAEGKDEDATAEYLSSLKNDEPQQQQQNQ